MWLLVRRWLVAVLPLGGVGGCALDYGAFSVQPSDSAATGGTAAGGGSGATGSGAAGSGAAGSGAAGSGAAGGAGPSGGASAGGFGGGGAAGGAGGVGGAAGGAGNAGGSGPVDVKYEATVADCTSTVNLSPDNCETQAGTGHMVIDTFLGSFDSTPYHVFLRFDFDASFQGKTVTSAVLRLEASDHNFTPGPSGELWQVAPFSRADLFVSLPANVGASPIGADLGSLDTGDVAQWSIPPHLITPNGALTLAVRPTSGDALAYWNNNGSVPPSLTVTAE